MSANGLVVVLGGGGARGLAHVGILEALTQHGFPVRAVAGTSIGAEVGAFFASGFPMDELCRIGGAVDWRRTLQLFMPDLARGGLCSGRKILAFLRQHFGDRLIETLPIPWIGIATDLDSGEEVVLDRGILATAVRASISLPGLLAPYRLGDRLLIDGGVVNSLPIDVARARFGGPILAVLLQPIGPRGHARRRRMPGWLRARHVPHPAWIRRARPVRTGVEGGGDINWRTRWVMSQSASITQAALIRLRLQQSPPDLLLNPEVRHIGPLEFYRGTEAIEAGRQEVRRRLPEIERLLVSGSSSLEPESGSNNPRSS